MDLLSLRLVRLVGTVGVRTYVRSSFSKLVAQHGKD